MTTTVHVYDKDTHAPIEGATVTCTDHTPQLTDGTGNVLYDLAPFTRYGLRADADGYVISKQQTIIGADPWVDFGLEKEEEITIAVKRPTWVSIDIIPSKSEYEVGETLTVQGSIRKDGKAVTRNVVWLIDANTGEVISDRVMSSYAGDYLIEWTPTKAGGYDITVGCDAFVDSQNPLGSWYELPNGYTKYITVVGGGEADMAIHLPNPYSLLFVDHTITACDDGAKACTEFRFQIQNTGDVAHAAWYKVSVVDGGTLYEATTLELDPGVTSEVIDDTVCALPGGLPVGTHTIKVEVGPVGEGLTASCTDTIHVIDEQEPETLAVTTYRTFFGIEETSAPAKGSVTGTNGVRTDVGFEYGKTTGYMDPITFTDEKWADATEEAGDFYADLIRLQPGTWYGFRAIAENQNDKAHGQNMWFETVGVAGGGFFSISLPNETLLEQSEVMACDDWQKACTYFNFQVSNNWSSGLTAWYKVSVVGGGTIYEDTGTIPGYGVSGTIRKAVCALPGGLPVGTHELKVEVGQVGQAATDSHIESLTVNEYGTPTVDTVGVEDPTLESATLVGALKDVGMPTEVGFEYGLLYGSMKTEWLGDTITGGAYKLAIDGLEGHNVYRYRAVARAQGKTSYGDELSFEASSALINTISLGWNLEDARMREYNVHYRVTNLSEAKRYRIVVYGDKGYEYARKDPVTGTKEMDIKVNIPLDLIEANGYGLSCGVYDLDKREYLITKATVIPSFDLKLTTNIGGTATVIPTTIRTETDYPFTIQIDNTGDKDRKAAIIFQFTGVGMGPLYIFPFPHAIPSELEEGAVIPAGESIGFEIIINLPNAAVPTGALSAMYNLDITLSAFEYDAT